MRLHSRPVDPVPERTARVARAAFPTGNPYVRMRDELGTVFEDGDFAGLFPKRGKPAFSPWRLALATIMPRWASPMADSPSRRARRCS